MTSGHNFDEGLLARLIEQARGGVAHELMSLLNDRDSEHLYEAAPAMPVVHDLNDDALDAAVRDTAWNVFEDHYYRYDDEGYQQQWFDVDAATVFSTDRLGLADPELARERWEAALAGPYPEGAREQLDALIPTMAPPVRARLEALFTP
ncbi:hypothetical protein ABT121_34665 [Streptomyces sp. NPDC001928]|uniref:hypothetical protein n=1 Tax=Streptomyces sp. NPDC001928 TaxID=3154404 RepID=UPI00332A79DA